MNNTNAMDKVMLTPVRRYESLADALFAHQTPDQSILFSRKESVPTSVSPSPNITTSVARGDSSSLSAATFSQQRYSARLVHSSPRDPNSFRCSVGLSPNKATTSEGCGRLEGRGGSGGWVAGAGKSPTAAPSRWVARRGQSPRGKSPCDERRRRQREKQIYFGYSTEGYTNMERLIQHDPLLRSGGVLPLSPPDVVRGSKRTWDIELRKWRRALHMFDYVFIDGVDDPAMRQTVLDGQRRQWVSEVYQAVPREGRVRIDLQTLLRVRTLSQVPTKIPVEEDLRCILRSDACYEPVNSVVPQNASSLTKGTQICPLAAGIKIHIAPSDAVLQRQQAQQKLQQQVTAHHHQIRAAASAAPSSPHGGQTTTQDGVSPSPRRPLGTRAPAPDNLGVSFYHGALFSASPARGSPPEEMLGSAVVPPPPPFTAAPHQSSGATTLPTSSTAAAAMCPPPPLPPYTVPMVVINDPQGTTVSSVAEAPGAADAAAASALALYHNNMIMDPVVAPWVMAPGGWATTSAQTTLTSSAMPPPPPFPHHVYHAVTQSVGATPSAGLPRRSRSGPHLNTAPEAKRDGRPSVNTAEPPQRYISRLALSPNEARLGDLRREAQRLPLAPAGDNHTPVISSTTPVRAAETAPVVLSLEQLSLMVEEAASGAQQMQQLGTPTRHS